MTHHRAQPEADIQRGGVGADHAKRTRQIYHLRLQSTGGDDIRHLRAILKILLRCYRLRCISIAEET